MSYSRRGAFKMWGLIGNELVTDWWIGELVKIICVCIEEFCFPQRPYLSTSSGLLNLQASVLKMASGIPFFCANCINTPFLIKRWSDALTTCTRFNSDSPATHDTLFIDWGRQYIGRWPNVQWWKSITSTLGGMCKYGIVHLYISSTSDCMVLPFFWLFLQSSPSGLPKLVAC